MYDSTEETIEHVKCVRHYLHGFIAEIEARGQLHDYSKLEEPEKSLNDELKPKLRAAETEYGYGSPQYEAVVKELNPLLRHHFDANRHHPEHYPNGINGMTLVDVLEMIADWKAASLRGGQSLNIEANKRRFNISDQLYEILQNTVKELGW
jgi:hypothetical protein